MKKIIFLILTILSCSVFANPIIFGMELGKTTEKDFKEMYQVAPTGTDEYNGGNVYSVPVQKIRFKGLSNVTAIFNQQGYLVAVLNKIPKNNFNSLHESFDKSYKLISEINPFVGDKSAKFREGATEITMDAPHNDPDMSLNYINDEYAEGFALKSKNETN